MEACKSPRHVVERLTAQLNWTARSVFKQCCFAGEVLAFVCHFREERKEKPFAVKQDAEFGLISCGLVGTIARGRQ